METWRKNLFAIFIAQFFVMVGFNFINPFLPLFIQDLGSFTNREAAFWSGMATAGLGISLFISGPVWGIVADRWGRKKMVLRAQFFSALILGSMALAPNVYWVLALRMMQGLFSGTMTAAQAMVAAGTPRNKVPFAMGLLMSAVFTGTTVGPLLGGTLADLLGYKATFYITGALLAAGGFIVLFFTKEEFEPPEPGQAITLRGMARLVSSREMLPILLTLTALQMGPQMVQPIIPVFIKDIDPSVRAATVSGVTFGLMGVTAVISSVFSARIAGRVSLKKILVFSAVASGLFYLPPVWAGTVMQITLFLALSGFMRGGLVTSTGALVGLTANKEQQGIAYGVGQSANALGIGIGPLIAGLLAPAFGLRAVLGVAGGIYILIGLAVARFLVDIKVAQPEPASPAS